MMPASVPDSDFTRFAAHGGEPAFRALVTKHLPMVLAVAERRLGEYGHLSEDVAQRVFTRLAKVARGLPPDTVVAAWLHRQAVRLSIDTVRAEIRRRRRETTAAAMLHPSDPPGPPLSSTPSWQDIRPLLDEAMDRLSAADRTVLILRYFQDRDFATVGAAVGSTPEAARKRIARGLEKLRAMLHRRGAVLPAAALATLLAQHPRQAAASALSVHAPLAAAISRNALAAAAAAGKGAAVSTLLLSHAAAVLTGAAAVLLAAALFYQHREEAMRQRLSFGPPVSAAPGSAEIARIGRAEPRAENLSDMDDETPKTLPEIIAALREIAAGPANRLNGLRMAALLRKVAPEQYLEFYTTAGPRIPQPGWRQLVTLSVRTWRGTDPGALTKALFESDNSKREEIRLGKLNGAILLNSLLTQSGPDGGGDVETFGVDAFETWLRRDFSAAVQWMQSREDTPLMRYPMPGGRPLYASYLKQVGGVSPFGAALADIGALSAAEIPPARMELWAKTLTDANMPVDQVFAVEWSPDEARLLGYQVARTRPELLKAWIQDQSPPSSANRFQAALGLVMTSQLEEVDSNSYAVNVTSLDPAERLEHAAFALENADGLPRDQALRAMTESWLDGSLRGLSELRDWLLATATPREAGAALETGARFLAQSPESMPEAMAFAAGIGDDSVRGPLQRGLFLRWRDANPAAAADFLKSAPPETAAALQSLTPVNEP